MKRLLIWSAILILTFGLLVTASRTLGGPIKPSKPTVADMLAADSYLGPHGWCWRDICPGQTDYDKAVTQLHIYQNRGFVKSVEEFPNGDCCSWETVTGPSLAGWFFFSKPVDYVGFRLPDNSLRLGDAISLFGDPVSVWLCAPLPIFGDAPNTSGNIFFKNGVEITVVSFSSDLHLYPEMIVGAVYYNSNNGQFPPPKPISDATPWDHFGLYPSHDCAY